MASKIKVDQIAGSSGSTITVPTGQTLTLTDGLAVASLPTVTVAKGGTNLTSFTAGDVLYATGSTTLAKLAKGTAEQVLAMNSGATAPDWGSVDLTVLPTITVAKGGTNLSSFTAGDILYATGATTLAKLAKGTALYGLRMNAGATAPEWAESSGGKTVKRHYFSNNTRTAGNASADTDQLTLTSSFIPVDPTAGNNDLWVQWISPINSAGQSWSCIGVRMSKSGGSDYDFKIGHGYMYSGDTSNQAVQGSDFHIAAGTIPAGTYTVKLRCYDVGGANPDFYSINTTDNNRVVGQQATTMMITEYKN